MANKPVSLQLPVELVEAIEARAKATGQSITKFVIAELAKFYGLPHSLPQSVTIEQLQELQQLLNELEHLIAILSAYNQLEFRLTHSEQQSVSNYPKRSHLLDVAEQN